MDTKRGFGGSVLIGLLALCVLVPAMNAAEKAKPLNVLFIIADDLNCDLGAYGHPLVKTPHLDLLAERGTLFSNAFSNFPLCGPSRASFMTGLYPAQNGVTTLRRLFRDYVPEAVTLSQHFQAQGHVAARVGKIYHYDNPLGVGTNGHDDAASWDRRVNPIGRDRAEEDKIFSLRPGSFGATLSWLAAEGSDEEQTDGMVASESIELLKEFAGSGQSFFLGVGFYRPHTPFVAPKKYFNMYDPAEIKVPRVRSGYLDTLPKAAVKSIRRRQLEIDLPEETIRKAIHAYYASISFMDAQVGRVLEALEALGLRENTVVLFTSDHGYHMGEHGYFQKATLFEASDRVPLIVSTPGAETAGRHAEGLVEMIDFYRSLSELAGASAPPKYVQGESFARLVTEVETEGRDSALSEVQNGYTLRTERYRFSLWNESAGGGSELYDRLSDPAEQVNVAGDPVYADVAEKLEKRLRARIEEATTPVEGLAFTPPKTGDNGYHRKEILEMEQSGTLPR